MNTNISTRENAIKWWKLQTEEYKRTQFSEFIKTYHTPSKTFASLTGREIEIIYSSLKLSENAIKGNAAMNTNITKGKWAIQEAAPINHVVYSLLDGNRIDICCTYAGTVGKEQSEANAQAIASLPDIMRENEELKKLAASFYMDICRAYNAGKKCMNNQHQDAREKGKDSFNERFVSSHDYFVSEFPTFKTNVP
jgi:hypothetical protein